MRPIRPTPCSMPRASLPATGSALTWLAACSTWTGSRASPPRTAGGSSGSRIVPDLPGGRDDPDGDVESVERARYDPAIAAIVAGADGDEYAADDRRGVALDQHLRRGAPGGVHQTDELGDRSAGQLIPLV